MDLYTLSRRRFLRQSFAWSALASMPLGSRALSHKHAVNPHAAHALVIGDWGYVDKPKHHHDYTPTNTHEAQSQVARGMAHYARSTGLETQALWLLGDNFYGDLDGGVQSTRWKGQFEQMYPASLFPGPAYAMLGNHDYQMLPPGVNKVEAQLAYAKSGRGLDGKATRWTMPARWYTFDFPAEKPLVHCIVLDSNMPKEERFLHHGTSS